MTITIETIAAALLLVLLVGTILRFAAHVSIKDAHKVASEIPYGSTERDTNKK